MCEFFKIKQYRKFSRPEKLFFATFFLSSTKNEPERSMQPACRRSSSDPGQTLHTYPSGWLWQR